MRPTPEMIAAHAERIASDPRPRPKSAPPPKPSPIYSPTTILDHVARYYHLTPFDIVGPCKFRSVAMVRHLAAYLMRHHTGMSLCEIAREVGKTDHTTIKYALKRTELRIKTDWEFAARVDEIRRRMKIEATAGKAR